MNHIEADRQGGHIRTYSGRFISLTAPQQEDIVLVDIAHSLACLNRYTGHVPWPYSVAQHSILASYLVPEVFALDGLLHDATESYLTDLSSPLKKLPGMEEYRRLENNVFQPAVARKFGVSSPIPVEVKAADWLAYQLEVVCLFGEPAETVAMREAQTQYQHLLKETSWQDAKELFLDRYHEILKGTQG